MILALGVPLAITLGERTIQDFASDLLIRTQDIAARIDDRSILGPAASDLQRRLVRGDPGGLDRIIVVATDGTLVADSDGPASLGEDYAQAERPEIVSALNEQPNHQVRHSDDLGQDIVVAAAPVFGETASGGGGRVLGAVRITKGIDELQSDVRATQIGLVVICSGAMLAGLVLAFVLSGQLARPLAKLTTAARRLGRGDLAARAGDVGTGGEVGELAHSFDDMAERTERTVQAQREFVANASHQLRTPLTGMKLRLEAAIEAAPACDLQRQLRAADLEIDRLSVIVDRLLIMAKRIETGDRPRADVGDAIDRALHRWNDRAERAHATLAAEGSGGTVEADAADLDQILDNLVENAITYAAGNILLRSERRDDRLAIIVRDRGPGLPAHELSRVTERFYRAGAAGGGGSGLGLAIARDLAEKWGGTIELSTPDGGGLSVAALLPTVESDRAGETPVGDS